MSDVYEKLAKHLDKLPAGFPPTESGVELRILKRMFTQEEAELATCLMMMPEPVPAIAARTGRDEAQLADNLASMAKRGLIFRINKNGMKLYSAAQFVIGIWEYHLNDLDEDLVRDVNEYLPYLSKVMLETKTKQLRVIPISKSITADLTIASYEDAEEMIKKQSKIVVQDCICRKEHEVSGNACSHPKEVCLAFGMGAYYYEENGLGREINVDEALKILETGREAGLVLQPGNQIKSGNICMCCGCSCQILKNTKLLAKPAEAVHSNFYAEIDEDECIACGDCVERCHMDAITLEETAHVNPDRCIGCGVCVPVCSVEAIKYLQKAPDDQYTPPANVVETYMNIAKDRGLI